MALILILVELAGKNMQAHPNLTGSCLWSVVEPNCLLTARVQSWEKSTHVKKRTKKTPELPVIGWREWVKLPSLGIERIKVKVDTGARTSSLHVLDLEEFTRRGKAWVRFKVHPIQRTTKQTIQSESPVLEYRSVRNSGGKASLRPVIVTNVLLLGNSWPVELTLANRDEMGFRMLLGREAIRQRFLVDSGGSYYNGKPKRRRKKKT